MKLKDFSIVLLLIGFTYGQAQFNLDGIVTASDTNQKLIGVEIFLDNQTVLSDSNGAYQFIDVEKGLFKLSAYAEGFQLYEVLVDLDKNLTHNIQLEPIITLSTLEVKAQQKEVFNLRRMQDVEGTSILAGKKNEVVLVDQLTANLATNNARQIYSQVVGLNIFDYNDGGLQLGIGGRGLDPNRTANFNTRQNGYDISADVLGYPESYYTPPAEALQEVQIIRGAASLQYGTQFGGLINFKFKEPKKNTPLEFETRNTIGSHDLFTSFNSISGTNGRLSYYGFFNYKKGNSFRPNSDFESFNYFGKLNYQISPRTDIRTEYTHFGYLAHQPGGLTDQQFYEDPTFSNRERNWFRVDWNLLNVQFNHTFKDEAKFSTQFFGLQSKRKALGFRDNRVSAIDELDSPRDLIVGEFNNWGVESKYLQYYNFRDFKNVWMLGAKYYHAQNAQTQGPGSRASDADFDFDYINSADYRYQSDFKYPNRNLTFFGETIWNVTDKFSVTPGFRYEWIKTSANGQYKYIITDLAGNVIDEDIFNENIDKKRSFLLYGLGLSYKASKTIEFYGNFSKNYRSVTFTDIHTTSPNFFVADDITDETGFTVDVGARGKYRNLISFDSNGFVLLYDNKIGEYIASNPNSPYYGLRGRDNIGKAVTYGLESLVDLNLSKILKIDSRLIDFHYFINSTFTHSQYLNTPLDQNIEGNKVEFVPTVNIKTGIGFAYKSISTNLLWTYLSKQYTDATNARQSKDDKISGIVGEIPMYHIMDLSVSYQYKRFTIESGLNNLLDRSYFVRRASGYPGPGIIPSNPRTYYITIGIKL
ncbi:TonB-dependent receptor plug domain-containing protein [Flavobacteriaceae bacterium Ap0902]|nr:TonB-dependent receptor plug domain-containing protein [Flavobacteriaceae bacterium Ap0902]